MSKLFLCLALLLSTVSSLASAAGTDAGIAVTLPLSSEDERSRIQAERALAEATYEREEAACYERFAVTDCIRKVRKLRREVLDRLRKQEVVINANERKRKALDQLERIKEKSSEDRLAEEAAKRLEARSAQQEREESATQKEKASGAFKQAPSDGNGSRKTVDQSLTSGDIAKNRQQYKEKLREADENRANRLKSNSEKTGTPKKPLPDYP
jgi:colicin import membrane protein